MKHNQFYWYEKVHEELFTLYPITKMPDIIDGIHITIARVATIVHNGYE